MSHVFRDRKSNEVKAENREEFIRYVMEQKSVENLIFWNTVQPCFSGTLFFGTERFAKEKKNVICSSIKLSFDARVCMCDARWTLLLEDLFIQVAKKLSTIYAMVHVDENMGISKRGT